MNVSLNVDYSTQIPNNIGLTEDLTDGLEACELCNQLGVDTMSIGNTVNGPNTGDGCPPAER